MKLVVICGSGLIGTKVVKILSEQGHEALAASPKTGVDATTGRGWPQARYSPDRPRPASHWEPLVPPFRRAVLHDEVLAFDIPERAHGLQKLLQEWLVRSGRTKQIPDPVHVLRRLCLGSEWCQEKAEGESDEKPNKTARHGSLPGSSTCEVFYARCTREENHLLQIKPFKSV
jgi:hypothetical protein